MSYERDILDSLRRKRSVQESNDITMTLYFLDGREALQFDNAIQLICHEGQVTYTVESLEVEAGVAKTYTFPGTIDEDSLDYIDNICAQMEIPDSDEVGEDEVIELKEKLNARSAFPKRIVEVRHSY